MDPPKLSFGLARPIKPLSKPPSSRKPIFSQADDDDSLPSPIPSTSKSTSKPDSKVSTSTLSRAQKKKQKEELELDSSVYEYDEVFDSMKDAAKQADLIKKKDAGDRKPKYISKLMETAEQRKQDRVRAEDKMTQLERDREGDEFADKDAFVTPAYLAQQEELRKVEEEEKKKEEANAKKQGGMSSFFKEYLNASSAAHEAAVAATKSRPILGAAPPPPPTDENKEKTDTQIAAELAAQTGRKVIVNDDGEIIDHRELLSGGLNVFPKDSSTKGKGGSTTKERGLGFSATISERKAAADAEASSSSLLNPSGLSAAERGRQSRERHSREVQKQMLLLEEKRKREAEENLEKEVKKVAKRNDETKVEELRRKAAERRKAREEELAAAAGTETNE